MISLFFIRNQNIWFFIVGTLLLYSPTSYAETISWAVADRPTSYILEGPDKGKGVVDEVYSLLHEKIRDFEHSKQKMTFGRILLSMEMGNNICACGFKKPEREKVGYFSIPAIIALPFSIVAKKGHLKSFFGDISIISLVKLLQNKNLIGGITQKRSYGGINSIIKEHEEKKTLYIHASTHLLIEMLLKNRVDYVIEIPSFARYIAKQMGSEEEIESFAIKENKQQVLIAHIFCTKNNLGRHIIDRINEILKNEISSPKYLEILERWYDEKSRYIIREHYNTKFLKK